MVLARLRPVVLGGALALVAVGCARTAQDRLDRARALAFRQNFTGAVAEYESLLTDLTHDESVPARDLRAAALRGAADLSYLQLADYVRAARLYRDLCERYPDRPETFEARANMADILRDHFHDTRGALAQLAALVQSFPNHQDTDRFQYRAAQDYFDLRDYRQAETELHLFLSRFPGSTLRPDAELLLASALAYQGRRDEAIAIYQRVVVERPGADAGRANLELARLAEEAGEYERAEAFLSRAVVDYPEPRVVTLALERVKHRVALRRPVDIKDHAAIFDHAAESAAMTRDTGE
jgi:TolA-binding protein